MNTLTGLENLIKQPSKLKCFYWVAYADEEGHKNKLADNHNSENMTQQEAENQLREFINQFLYSGCNIHFHFTKEPGANALKGGYHMPFYLPASIIPHSGVGNAPSEKVEDIVARKMHEYETKRRIEELEKENRELKELNKSLDTPVNRIIGRLEPHAELLINAAFNKKVIPTQTSTAMAGTQTEQEAQKILEDSLQVLADGEPDFHIVMQKLANLKKNDPAKYNIAKSML